MKKVRIRKSVLLPTLVGWLSGRKRPMSAVTIRHTIYVHPDAWNHLRHGYKNNPFEVEARLMEDKNG